MWGLVETWVLGLERAVRGSSSENGHHHPYGFFVMNATLERSGPLSWSSA